MKQSILKARLKHTGGPKYVFSKDYLDTGVNSIVYARILTILLPNLLDFSLP